MKSFDGSPGEKKKKNNPEKGKFKYDEEDRLVKSKIVSFNNKKYGRKGTINIVYDKSGDILKKDRINIDHDI